MDTTLRWLADAGLDPEAVIDKIVPNERWGRLDYRLEKGGTLFAGFHPDMVYRDWAPVDDSHASASVLVGVNLGYGLNHVLTNTSDRHKVIVVEPDPAMLLACLGQSDYSPFMKVGKVEFLPPDREALAQAVRGLDVRFLFGSIHLRLDLPSRQISGEYALWGRICQELLENATVEYATLRRKQDVMVGNELANFQRAMTEGGVERLQGMAKGLPAVILGAGPSLGEIGPELAEAPGCALYATALQTLPVLQEMGIKPHFCMAIDYSEGMRRLYDRLDTEWAADIPLIYSTKLNPEVLARYPGPTIPMWTLGGMATYLVGDSGFVLDAAGNVSVALLRFLAWCGVERIILAGQDFGWQGDSTHVRGHHSAGHKATYKTVEIKNRDGETLHSSMSILTALRDMERDIESISLPVYNIYGGGAVINGSRHVTLEEAHDKGLLASTPGALDRFKGTLGTVGTPSPWPHVSPLSHEWATSLRSVQKRLDKLFKKAERNQVEIHRAFTEVHIFLRQNPLYLPYLYNEIMDVAGLAQTRIRYVFKDQSEFKGIMKRVLQKTREMDRVLCGLDRKAA